MGFFGNLKDALFKPKLTDPVRGTAQVVSSSMPPHQSGDGMCEMNLDQEGFGRRVDRRFSSA